MKNNLKKIKCIVLDVDGVLTDGKIIITSTGEDARSFNVHDGMGIAQAQKEGIIICFVSGGNSNVVKIRAKNLGVKEVYQGNDNKKEIIKKIKEKYSLKSENICFVGDDINDIETKKEVGILFAVKNASDDLKKVADYITKRQGGNGAVREIIEMVLKSQGKWQP